MGHLKAPDKRNGPEVWKAVPELCLERNQDFQKALYRILGQVQSNEPGQPKQEGPGGPGDAARMLVWREAPCKVGTPEKGSCSSNPQTRFGIGQSSQRLLQRAKAAATCRNNDL
jgi:hypothetical protein